MNEGDFFQTLGLDHINAETSNDKIIQETNFYDHSILSTKLECCYNEFKYYKENGNEVAALGWAVSYNLQFLWQNSPKMDTIQNYQLSIKQDKPSNEQKLKEIQNFLQSKGIEPLVLHYTPYPTNLEEKDKKIGQNFSPYELRKRAELYSYNTGYNENLIREEKRLIRFYTTLDWDKFYMQFPLLKDNEKIFFKDMIYTNKFKKQIENILFAPQNAKILHNLSSGEYDFYFAIDIRENRSNENAKSYLLSKGETPFGYKLTKYCKPFEIDNLNCQTFSVTDSFFMNKAFEYLKYSFSNQMSYKTLQNDFRTLSLLEKFTLFHPNNFAIHQSNQTYNKVQMNFQKNLALYACSGKFSINYVPINITIKKDESHRISFRVNEIFAYVYDSFDFLDQSHEFDDNGNIIKLGQPVGAWDFNEKSFSIWGSIRQMDTYKSIEYLGYAIPNITIEDVLQAKKTNRYYIYNQDYQDYQKFTPYGLDFRVFSDNFIKKIDFTNEPIHHNL